MDFVRELGADTVIDYRNEDFEQRRSDYDLVLDSLGGKNLKQSLRVLKPGAWRLVSPGRPIRRLPAKPASTRCSLGDHLTQCRHQTPGQEARSELRVPVHARQW